MATIINTKDYGPADITDPDLVDQIYNGIDCCVTAASLPNILENFGPEKEYLYQFEMRLNAAFLGISVRGIPVDNQIRLRLAGLLERRMKKLQGQYEKIILAFLGAPLNYNSPAQLVEFFYERVGVPPIWIRDKSGRRMTCNRDALEEMSEKYLFLRPIISHILALRDIKKQMEVLRRGVDDDGRMRFTLKPAGTDTGRAASAMNPMGGGQNGQNITDELRQMFVANGPGESGWKMAYLDLEQAESRIVAYLSGDENYIQANESGDTHTYVTRMIWPDKPWTGDLPTDRQIADAKFYRQFSYRDMSKRGAHATNYFGKPYTIAKHLKIAQSLVEHFQARYFEEFPGIPEWQKETIQTIQMTRQLTTPSGRLRTFWGRPEDAATWRKAIAHKPQSLIGDIIDRAIIYLKARERSLGIELLMQVHDAILFRYRESDEAEVIPKVATAMRIPVTISGAPRVISVESSVGWNWRKASEKNPGGISKYKLEA